MPALDYVWIVRDPTSDSTLADICWRQSVAQLGDYVIGSDLRMRGSWGRERHTLYTDEAAATADAEARLGRLRNFDE